MASEGAEWIWGLNQRHCWVCIHIHQSATSSADRQSRPSGLRASRYLTKIASTQLGPTPLMPIGDQLLVLSRASDLRPAQFKVTQMAWMHLNEVQLFQQLSGKPSDDKILDLTLGEASALRIKKLFPTLHELGESVEVLRAAKAEWTKGNSAELYSFISECGNRLLSQVVAENDPQALNDAPPSPVDCSHASKNTFKFNCFCKKGRPYKDTNSCSQGESRQKQACQVSQPPLKKSQKNATPAASDGSLTDDEGLNTVPADDGAADPREDVTACSPLFLFLTDEEDQPQG
ncbi:hypothetical protein B0H13DRAFT_1895132 [Mycena leptocephala]|nr:hypothetical protein B0H13DRAFT_1895132 [Mycena leptocephala]